MVSQINAFDASNEISKTQYDSSKEDLEKDIKNAENKITFFS